MYVPNKAILSPIPHRPPDFTRPRQGVSLSRHRLAQAVARLGFLKRTLPPGSEERINISRTMREAVELEKAHQP